MSYPVGPGVPARPAGASGTALLAGAAGTGIPLDHASD